MQGGVRQRDQQRDRGVRQCRGGGEQVEELVDHQGSLFSPVGGRSVPWRITIVPFPFPVLSFSLCHYLEPCMTIFSGKVGESRATRCSRRRRANTSGHPSAAPRSRAVKYTCHSCPCAPGPGGFGGLLAQPSHGVGPCRAPTQKHGCLCSNDLGDPHGDLNAPTTIVENSGTQRQRCVDHAKKPDEAGGCLVRRFLPVATVGASVTHVTTPRRRHRDVGLPRRLDAHKTELPGWLVRGAKNTPTTPTSD